MRRGTGRQWNHFLSAVCSAQPGAVSSLVSVLLQVHQDRIHPNWILRVIKGWTLHSMQSDLPSPIDRLVSQMSDVLISRWNYSHHTSWCLLWSEQPSVPQTASNDWGRENSQAPNVCMSVTDWSEHVCTSLPHKLHADVSLEQLRMSHRFIAACSFLLEFINFHITILIKLGSYKIQWPWLIKILLPSPWLWG